jgi:hypothetical protein
MRREQALKIIAVHAAELHGEFPVERLSIFGSVARDEARVDSDVDLLVKFRVPVSLLEFARLRHRLESWLGQSVDLAEEEALDARHRERILREAVRVA